MKFLSAILAISPIFLLFQVARAQQQQQPTKWTLTTADFQTKQVDLSSIDDAGVRVNDQSGSPPRLVKWDELVLLDRALESKSASGKFVVSLLGGEQLHGEPVKLSGETLTWKSSSVGDLDLPLRQVAKISRAGAAATANDEAKRTEDVVQLANGDSVRGIVSDIANDQITVQVSGTPTPVPLGSVAAVLFASTGAARPVAGERTLRVKLSDDSVITAPTVATEGDQLVLKLKSGGTRKVPLSAVAGIEQLNGPVSWLSSRQPSENVQTPFLETTRPAKMDRTINGKPIRFGERTFARGIGVVPYSKITWPLADGGDYQTFRTQYTIDGAAPYADVTVRIRLDGEVVHEKAHVTAGEISSVILVPLKKAKTITLEVDFGDNYGVQDKLDWIEPALVKGSGVAPASPTTATTSP